MITTRITMWALPAQVWEAETSWGEHLLSIRPFVEDALAIERRMARGVNIENERTRYCLCCARMEAALKALPHRNTTDDEGFRSASAASLIPTCDVGPEYVDAVETMYQKASAQAAGIRLGATYFTPGEIGEHLAGFSSLAVKVGLADGVDIQKRVAFLRSAQKWNCGIVELQDPYAWQDAENLAHPANTLDNAVAAYYEVELDEGVSDDLGRGAYAILGQRVSEALRRADEGRPGEVNFSNQPHNIITEVLNEFAYSTSGHVERPTYINVVYTDGSQGQPFPLRCLPTRSASEFERLSSVRPLRVALLSMRHLAMDHDVDMAWLRNREVSKARAFSETDSFCYAQTQKQLCEVSDGEELRLYLYQTGLQPAVIGFFRALVEELLRRANLPPSVEVIPFYHRSKGGYQQGSTWH